MELLWKIERFCATATLEQLRAKQEELEKAVLSGALTNINAEIALKKVREGIVLNTLFGEC